MHVNLTADLQADKRCHINRPGGACTHWLCCYFETQCIYLYSGASGLLVALAALGWLLPVHLLVIHCSSKYAGTLQAAAGDCLKHFSIAAFPLSS
jgi:hypothetical protein